MKFFAVFAAIVAVACANNTWTLQQLSDALQSPYTDPALKPHLEAALNEVMESIFAGHQIEAVTVTIPSTDVSSMTLNELSEALQNPNTDPALIPHLETALNQMMEAIFAGHPVEAAVVPAPAMEIHHYTLSELSQALQNPATNPALVPYLENALNEIMDALIAGHTMEAITIVVPAGLAPVEVPTEVIPAPVDNEVVAPVAPETPASPAAPASPLVQIIVNINQKQQAAVVPGSPVVVPAEEITADAVNVVDSAPIEASPVQVVDSAPIEASPVQVIESPPAEIVDVFPVVAPHPVPAGVVVPSVHHH